MATTTTSSSTSSDNTRNWLDLPRELVVVIFEKLGVVLMLTKAQLVCTMWRKIMKDPIFFRNIRLRLRKVRDRTGHDDYDPLVPIVDAVKFTYFAIERSCGQLACFSYDDMSPFEKRHLHYIADSSTSSLKSLRLGCLEGSVISIDNLVEVIKKIPSLKDLKIDNNKFSRGVIEEISRSCPKLENLQLAANAFIDDPSLDEIAFAIAENMPNLRRLGFTFYGRKNGLTHVGLKAIIDGCQHLDYVLLIQRCIGKLDCDLLKKCASRLQNIVITKNEYVRYEFHLKICDDVHSQVCVYELNFSDNNLSVVYVRDKNNASVVLCKG